MTDEYICSICGHRAGDHAVNNRCLNCDCVADPYLEQLVALRAELVEWESAHDNLARQLSIANDTVEIAWEGLRELEYQGFHLYVPDVTEIAQDYLRRIEKGGLPELRKQLDIAVEALKCYVKLIDDDLNENGQPLNKEWSDAFIKGLDALAEIEKIGGVNDTQSRQ